MNHLLGFGLFFLGGGVLAVWGGVERMGRKRAQVRRAVVVTARVVEIQADGGATDGEQTHYCPVVRFPIDG